MEFTLLEFTPLVYICLGCAIAMLLLRKYVLGSSSWLYALVFSFIIAIIGDYFLGIRTTDLGFVLGIAGYFLAHVGFLVYAWHNITGREWFSWKVLLAILIPFWLFYFIVLFPYLRAHFALAIAVFVYVTISCCTLSASINPRAGRRSWTWVYAAGVACLLTSDTFIALHNFADMHTAYNLYMWPFFYFAMILIAFAVLMQYFYEHRSLAQPDNSSEQYPVEYEYPAT